MQEHSQREFSTIPFKEFFYRKSFIGKRMLQTQSRGKIEEENLGQFHFGSSVLVIFLGR